MSADEYVIHVDVNGDDAAVADRTMTAKKLTALPTATRSGYLFAGWYTDPVAGTEITADTVFSGETTVYARWETKSMPFIDVPDDAYFKDAGSWSVGEGITMSVTATTFCPDINCTGAQISIGI